MEDPLYTLNFIKDIIKVKNQNIIGITIAKGDRFKIGKKKSKYKYLLSLLLIMGINTFLTSILKTLYFKLNKKINPSFGLKEFAKQYNIPINYTNNPNSIEFINLLKSNEIDIIINQSQFIIKSPFIESAKIGVLNRHNALLPKNRGRLPPFWVLYKQEKETGVSIHFVDTGIDSGPIVVQKKFIVTNQMNFKSIVNKNYSIAGKAMIEALDILEGNNFNLIENNDVDATYNSIPTITEAWTYRKRRLIYFFID